MKSPYLNIPSILEEYGMHGDSSRSTKAKGLLVQMKSCEFIAGLCILEKLFQSVNLASKALQDPGLDISGGITTIKPERD